MHTYMHTDISKDNNKEKKIGKLSGRGGSNTI